MPRLSSTLLCLLLSLPAFSQEALSRQLSLADLATSAGTIVRGQVIDSRVEPHPQYRNISTIRLTLRVADAIYGNTGQQITYRMFLASGNFAAPRNTTKYRAGDELILFMYPESQYGLTSPVGGDQGRFQVLRTGGKAKVVNGLNNTGLFQDLGQVAKAQSRTMTQAEAALSRKQSGAVGLDEFVAVVRQLAANRGTK